MSPPEISWPRRIWAAFLVLLSFTGSVALINLFDDLAKWGREYPVIADKLAFWGPLIAAAGVLLWALFLRVFELLHINIRPSERSASASRAASGPPPSPLPL